LKQSQQNCEGFSSQFFYLHSVIVFLVDPAVMIHGSAAYSRIGIWDLPGGSGAGKEMVTTYDGSTGTLSNVRKMSIW
jgi:hypothetical protein